MRLFVAIQLPESVKATIAAALEDFPIKTPPWRWIAASNWHLTLKFFGETDAQAVKRISSALAEVAAAVTVYRAVLGPFGAFPNFSRPRVLYYALDKGKKETANLAGAVDDALVATLGIAAERRPYRAHATVARVKHPIGHSESLLLSRVPPLSGGEFDVVSIGLIRSQLGPQGAYYEWVKQFALPHAK